MAFNNGYGNYYYPQHTQGEEQRYPAFEPSRSTAAPSTQQQTYTTGQSRFLSRELQGYGQQMHAEQNASYGSLSYSGSSSETNHADRGQSGATAPHNQISQYGQVRYGTRESSAAGGFQLPALGRPASTSRPEVYSSATTSGSVGSVQYAPLSSSQIYSSNYLSPTPVSSSTNLNSWSAQGHMQPPTQSNTGVAPSTSSPRVQYQAMSSLSSPTTLHRTTMDWHNPDSDLSKVDQQRSANSASLISSLEPQQPEASRRASAEVLEVRPSVTVSSSHSYTSSAAPSHDHGVLSHAHWSQSRQSVEKENYLLAKPQDSKAAEIFQPQARRNEPNRSTRGRGAESGGKRVHRESKAPRTAAQTPGMYQKQDADQQQQELEIGRQKILSTSNEPQLPIPTVGGDSAGNKGETESSTSSKNRPMKLVSIEQPSAKVPNKSPVSALEVEKPIQRPASSSEVSKESLETEIKALMSKMREFNEKDPALLARIWEEERKAHLQRSTVVKGQTRQPEDAATSSQKSRDTSKPARVHAPVQEIPAHRSPVTAGTFPQGTISYKSSGASIVSGSSSADPQTGRSAAASNGTKPVPAKPTTSNDTTAKTNSQHRSGGTIWPPDKKQQLAAAAAQWLNALSPNNGIKITGADIAKLLDANPSFAELCEIIEGRGFQIIRSAFAKALLAAVPSMYTMSTPKVGAQSTGEAQQSANGNHTIRQGSDTQGSKGFGGAMNTISGNRIPSPTEKEQSQANKQSSAASKALDQKVKATSEVVDLTRPDASVLSSVSAGNTWPNGIEANGHKPGGLTQARLNGVVPASALTKLNAEVSQSAPSKTVNKKPTDQSAHSAADSINPAGARFDEFKWRPHATQLSQAASLTSSGLLNGSSFDNSKQSDGQRPPYRSPYFNPHEPKYSIEQRGSGAVRQAAPAGPMVPQSFPPPSKEEAARKRNLSDIVDLTLASDNEDDHPKKRFASDGALGNMLNQTVLQNTDKSLLFPTLSAMDVATPQAAEDDIRRSHLVQSVSEEVKSMDVVRALDRRNAIRRSRYEPKTIARDVLLAAGRHPEMAHLNAHMDVLRSTFKNVDLSSDLSTFRWDMVDPGGPAPGTLNIVDEVERSNDADDEEESFGPAQARMRMASRRQLALLGGDTSSLIEDGMTSVVSKPVFKRRRGRPPRHSYPEGRSRPLGFGDGQQNTTPAHDSQRTDRVPERPQSEKSASGQKPTSYTAFRQALAADGTPLPKKKGRPFGWRKYPDQAQSPHRTAGPGRPKTSKQQSGLRQGESSTSKASEDPNNLDSAIRRRRGHNDPVLTYHVFKCQWKDCTAELHNLDTLRKHVHKLHGNQALNGRYDCLWAACGEIVISKESETGEETKRHRRLEFPTLKAWTEHVEKIHIDSLAWSLGDGPAGGMSDAPESEQSEAYLSDTRGRRVTPQVTAPKRNEEEQPTPPRGPGRPRKTDKQVALEAQKALERQKRDIGPGVDRGGARLATPKRRLGFIDDEDFEEIIDEQ